VNLYLGSGMHRMAGFKSVDKWPACGADYQWDVRRLEVPDGAIDCIVALHLIESFYQWEFADVLREWFRALKGGGTLVLEGTDFTEACRMALSTNPQQRLSGEWGMYGRQDRPEPNTETLHKFTWRKERLVKLLEDIGFRVTKIAGATTHDPVRDYRIEAVKPLPSDESR